MEETRISVPEPSPPTVLYTQNNSQPFPSQPYAHGGYGRGRGRDGPGRARCRGRGPALMQTYGYQYFHSLQWRPIPQTPSPLFTRPGASPSLAGTSVAPSVLGPPPFPSPHLAHGYVAFCPPTPGPPAPWSVPSSDPPSEFPLPDSTWYMAQG